MELTYKQLTIINEALQVLAGRMKGAKSQIGRLEEVEETIVIVQNELVKK